MAWVIKTNKSKISQLSDSNFSDFEVAYDTNNPSGFLPTFKVLFKNALNISNLSEGDKQSMSNKVDSWTESEIRSGVSSGWLEEIEK